MLIKRAGVIAFRPDDEVQEILDNITEKRSIYIRKAIKFYHQYQKSSTDKNVAFEIYSLREEIKEVAKKIDAIGVGRSFNPETAENNFDGNAEKIDQDECAFAQFAVKIGEQFMNWGQGVSNDAPVIEETVVDLEVADDEIEF